MTNGEREDQSASCDAPRARGVTIMRMAMLWLMCAGSLAISQTQRTAKKPEEFTLPMEEEKSALSIVQPQGMALESRVEPGEYFVGPSDVINVSIWMSPPISLPLTVTPEGSLIIPTVGEVMVADETLAAVKEKIVREVRKKYLSAAITATLVKPRPIVVNVSGNVLHPGLYTVFAVDRAQKAIEEANKLARLETQEDLKLVFEGMSTRNIVVRHRDGSQERVDIPRYMATHENRWNPYLREGDEVVVPKKNRNSDVFAVYGQINTPGRFEFVEGDSVLGAIRIAHGMTHLALGEKAILSRMNPDGTSLSNQIINIPEMIAGRSPDIPLESGDRIIIQQRTDLRGDFNVDVRGAVVHPGTYPITINNTRLSEIIRQAGGFTQNAALNSAEVLRLGEPSADIEKERILSLRGEPVNSDSSGYSLETDLRLHRASVNVDFDKLFMKNDTTQDIILQSEDQVLIPSRELTVYVFGQVALPGHIPIVKGKDAGYYVAKAGGYTDHANKGSLRIIKAKTKQWLDPGATTIEEGDYVWVPAEPDRPFAYYMTIASQSAAILSVIIGIVFIVQQASKH